jgi:O-antigen/teichoic acid export membrane protein
MRPLLTFYGILAGILVLAGASGFLPYSGVWAAGFPRAPGLLAAALMILPNFLFLYQIILMGTGATGAFASSLLLDQTLFCAGMAVVRAVGGDLGDALLARALALSGALLFSWAMAVPALKAQAALGTGSGGGTDAGGAWALLRCALFLFLNTAAGGAEVFALTASSGMAAAGDYRISLIAGTAFLVLPTALVNIIFPKAAFAAGRSDPSSLTKVFHISALLLGVGCLLCAAAAPWAVEALFGPEFRGGLAPLLWRLPGIWAYALIWILTSEVNAIRRFPLYVCLGMAWLCLVSIGGTLLMAPVWGASGAGMAFSLGACSTLGWLWARHARSLKAERRLEARPS